MGATRLCGLQNASRDRRDVGAKVGDERARRIRHLRRRPIIALCFNKEDEDRWCEHLGVTAAAAATPTVAARGTLRTLSSLLRRSRQHARNRPWFHGRHPEPHQCPQTVIGELTVEIAKFELVGDALKELCIPDSQSAPQSPLGRRQRGIRLSQHNPGDAVPDVPLLQHHLTSLSPIQRMKQDRTFVPASKGRAFLAPVPDSCPDLRSPIVFRVSFDDRHSDGPNGTCIKGDRSTAAAASCFSSPITSTGDTVNVCATFACISSLSHITIDLLSLGARNGYAVDDDSKGQVLSTRMISLHEVLERDSQRMLAPLARVWRPEQTQTIPPHAAHLRTSGLTAYDEFHSVSPNETLAPVGWGWYALRRTTPAHSRTGGDDVVAVVLCRVTYSPTLSKLIVAEPRSDLPLDDSKLDAAKLAEDLGRAEKVITALQDLSSKFNDLPKWEDPPSSMAACIAALVAILISNRYFLALVPLGMLACLALTLIDRLTGECARRRIEGDLTTMRGTACAQTALSTARGAYRRTAWLRVAVIRGRHLKAADLSGYSDPYVRVSYHFPGRQYCPLTIGHTAVRMQTLNPTWIQPYLPSSGMPSSGMLDGFENLEETDEGNLKVCQSCGSFAIRKLRLAKRCSDWSRGRGQASSTRPAREEREHPGDRRDRKKKPNRLVQQHAHYKIYLLLARLSRYKTRILRLTGARSLLRYAGLLNSSHCKMGFQAVWGREDGVVYPESFRIPVLEPVDDAGTLRPWSELDGTLLFEVLDADGVNGKTSHLDDFLGQARVSLRDIPRGPPYVPKTARSGRLGWLPLEGHARRTSFLRRRHGLQAVRTEADSAAGRDLKDHGGASESINDIDSINGPGFPSSDTAVSSATALISLESSTSLMTNVSSKNSAAGENLSRLGEFTAFTASRKGKEPLGAIQVHCCLEIPDDEDRCPRPTPGQWSQMLTFQERLEVPRGGGSHDWLLTRMLKNIAAAGDKQRQFRRMVRYAEQLLGLLTWVHPMKSAIVAVVLGGGLAVCLALPSRFLLATGVACEFGFGYVRRRREAASSECRARPSRKVPWFQFCKIRFLNLLQSLPSEPEIEAVFAEQRKAVTSEVTRNSLMAKLLATWCGKLWLLKESRRAWQRRYGAIQESRLLFWLTLEDADQGLVEHAYMLLHRDIIISRAPDDRRVIILTTADALGGSSPSNRGLSERRLIIAVETAAVADEVVDLLHKGSSLIGLRDVHADDRLTLDSVRSTQCKAEKRPSGVPSPSSLIRRDSAQLPAFLPELETS